jgi:hypothetical protein
MNAHLSMSFAQTNGSAEKACRRALEKKVLRYQLPDSISFTLSQSLSLSLSHTQVKSERSHSKQHENSSSSPLLAMVSTGFKAAQSRFAMDHFTLTYPLSSGCSGWLLCALWSPSAVLAASLSPGS